MLAQLHNPRTYATSVGVASVRVISMTIIMQVGLVGISCSLVLSLGLPPLICLSCALALSIAVAPSVGELIWIYA